MGKRLLLGIGVAVGLVVAGAALFLTLRENDGGRVRFEREETALAGALASETGAQAEVEFVCRLPVVGVAPCVLGDDLESREVTLTFTALALPEGTDPQQEALRIALLAHERSALVREAEATRVIFARKSSSMTFSFAADELKAAAPGVTGYTVVEPADAR